MEPTVPPTEVQTIPGRVLVRVQEGTPVEQVQEIAKAVGAEVDRVLAPWGLYLLRFRESVPVQEVIQQLQSYAAVRYAEPDVRYDASGLLETNAFAQTMDGPGSSVVVAVIDTGMDLRHSAFADRLYVNAGEIAGDGIDNDHNGYVDDVNGYDFYGNGLRGDGDPTGASGSGAHGTMVAGRVLQGASDSGVSILSLRVGPGPDLYVSAIVEAVSYAVAQGARVINMSFGGGFTQSLADAVQYAVQRGVLVVAAAGNSGWSLPSYPAALPGVISVAASDATGQKASWSNYGGTVDFTAPGQSVTTTTFGGGIAQVSGTSFSAPFLAGVAARILAALPQLTPAQVIDKLRSFAKDVYALNPAFYRGLLGAGLIDNEVATRVANALPISPALPPDPPSADQRAQWEAELVSARQEAQRLEGELAAADQALSLPQQKVAAVNQQVTAAERAVQAGWKELLDSWKAWYRSGFAGPTNPIERETLRQKIQQGWDKLFKAFADRRDAQARLRAAIAEETQARIQRSDIAARLQTVRGRVDELTRRLAEWAAPQTQAQTHSMVHQLQGVLQRLQADPIPPGIFASSADPVFPEISDSDRSAQ